MTLRFHLTPPPAPVKLAVITNTTNAGKEHVYTVGGNVN
jgi:hypothetical protein